MKNTSPYLLVHHDGSIALLADETYWDSDPDMYVWHSEGEYIVDFEGRVLEADTECKKHDDFNCFWKFSGKTISSSEAASLAKKHAQAEKLEYIPKDNITIRELFNLCDE